MIKRIIAPIFSYLTILFVTVWLIGFVVFSLYALSFKFSPAEKTDGIVVLTGGGDRIATALSLLEEGYAKKMLISGVNPIVQAEDIMQGLSDEFVRNVTLGYLAEDTRGNARETADWIKTNNVRSILLVTSFYHMPRSIYEVLRLSPTVQIKPLPVFPKSFNDSVDWIRTRYAWLLFVEYHKFIAVHVDYFLKGF